MSSKMASKIIESGIDSKINSGIDSKINSSNKSSNTNSNDFFDELKIGIDSLSKIFAEYKRKDNIEIELRIGVGEGYVPSEENELPNAPIGTLAMDSIFNPVTKVTYNVQPVPGAKDPIEILSVEVETDGSVTPQDAISYSATVLMDHLKLVEAIAKPEVLEVTERLVKKLLR